MTYEIDAPHDFIPLKRRRISRAVFSLTIPGAAALGISALVGAWMLYFRPAEAPNMVAHTVVKSPEAPTRVAAAAANPYGALFDPRSTSGSTPVSLAHSFPLEAELESSAPEAMVATAEQDDIAPTPMPAAPQLAEGAPLPTPRPAELGSLASHGPISTPAPSRRLAQQSSKTIASAPAADNRSFFEKLFAPAQPSGPVLAYAAPESVVIDKARSVAPSPSARFDRGTAIYDISAHTVYLPNGTRLEAHSGLGDRLDNPRYVSERMRGPTPPNVYELEPREAPFHGVRALRLKPLGGSVYGRTGLLAHTYMLGPNGDSNGCVSFRNYNAFLQAYQNGEIKRLAVVSRLN